MTQFPGTSPHKPGWEPDPPTRPRDVLIGLLGFLVFVAVVIILGSRFSLI